VNVFTNVNDNPKPSLSKDAHGLPIDLVEPTCRMQQAKNSSTTMQNAPSLVNLQNAPTLVICCPLYTCLQEERREKNH
jgi:hypothetical protein